MLTATKSGPTADDIDLLKTHQHHRERESL